jgi:hypothetical protein
MISVCVLSVGWQYTITGARHVPFGTQLANKHVCTLRRTFLFVIQQSGVWR